MNFIARKPNAQAKVINGVDAYSINSKGKATYLSTIWTGSYKLNKKATLRYLLFIQYPFYLPFLF